MNKVNTIKHYLKKNIFKQKDDMLKGVISKNLLLGRDANVTLRSEMRDVYLFLEWKVKQGTTIYSQETPVSSSLRTLLHLRIYPPRYVATVKGR